MDSLNLDFNKRYNYADYLTWMDDVRRELFDGFIKQMTPAPSRKRQQVSTTVDDRGCLGAPDVIIEIVSAGNSKRDIRDKFDIYQEHGVKEYWIVNPNDENVNVFVLDESGKYQFKGLYARDDKIPVNIFNGDFKN